MQAIAVVSAIAIALLLLVLLVVRSVIALVRETRQGGRHSKISAYAKLNGCGEVRVEVAPLEPGRQDR